MKRLICFIVLFLIVLPIKCSSQDWKDWQKVDKINEPLTGAIYYLKDGKPRNLGTGVVIDTNVFVTCTHVITGRSNFIFFLSGQAYNAVLLDSTGKTDGIAFMQFDGYVSNPAQIGNIVMFEEVMVKGSPPLAINLPSFRKVIYHVPVNKKYVNYDVYFLDGSNFTGKSGAGVWNRQGKLVGMMYIVYVDRSVYAAVTYFTSAKDIMNEYQKYLFKQGIIDRFDKNSVQRR